MAAKRDEMTLWTGYFDSRLSRSNGRRVPKQASIPKPTLESVVWAARSAGVRMMRQEPEVSHPSRPHAKEGRLVMPPSHVFEVTGTSSKEGAMQAIGTALNRRSKEATEQAIKATLTRLDPEQKINTTELAAWTVISRVLLNLSETITRN